MALVVLVGLVALCGCNDKDKRQSEGGTSATKASKTPDAKPLDFELHQIQTANLLPLDRPQTVEVKGRVKVTVPAGLLKAPAKLTISSLGKPPEPLGGCQRLDVFDVSLGDKHLFDKDILVEIPCDVTKIRDDVPPNVAVIASHYDAAANAWVQVPCRIDRRTHSIEIRTKHLSPIAAHYLGQDYRFSDCKDASGKVAAQVCFSDAELKKIYLDRWKRNPAAGPNKRVDSKGKPVPDFVADTCDVTESAIAAYARIGRRPASKPLVLIIYGTGDPAHTEVSHDLFWSEYVIFVAAGNYIDQDTGPIRFTRYDRLKYSMAHEIFHNCQMSDFTKDQNLDHRWWMEVTAEYAASRVAMSAYPDMGKMIDIDPASLIHFFDTEITFAPMYSQDMKNKMFHSYQSTHFVEQLLRIILATRKDGAAAVTEQELFKQLYEAVAPACGKNDSDALLQVQAFLQKHSVMSMADAMSVFTLWYMFHEGSPVAQRLGQGQISGDLPAKKADLSPGSPKAEYTFSYMSPDGMAYAWAVRKAKGDPLTVSCRIDGHLTEGMDIRTILLPGNRRIQGDFKSIWKQAGCIVPGKPVVVTLRDDDVLYVVGICHPVDGAIILGSTTVKIEPEVDLGGYWKFLKVEHNPKPITEPPAATAKHVFKSDVGKVTASEVNPLSTRTMAVTWGPLPDKFQTTDSNQRFPLRMEGDVHSLRCNSWWGPWNNLQHQNGISRVNSAGPPYVENVNVYIVKPGKAAKDQAGFEVIVSTYAGEDTFKYTYEWVPKKQ